MNKLFSRNVSINIGGYQQISDATTSGTPIPIPNTGVYTLITNDDAGLFSRKEWLPHGITNLWDADTNSFDFSELENGDSVDVRLDLIATVGTISSTIDVRMDLGIGGSTPYTLPVGTSQYYLTIGAKRIVDFISIGIDNDNTRLNPAQIKMASTDNLSVVVNGFLVRVHKRLV